MDSGRGNAVRAAAWGALIVLVYLGSAFLSSRLAVTARRPLLDGFGPPPPYRYVDPPPDALSKEKPASARHNIKMTPPDLGAGVFATSDQQASLVLEPGVFPAGTAPPVTLVIEPLDPKGFSPAPKGFGIVGNVYRFAVTSGSGAAVGELSGIGHLVLVYPAPTDNLFTASHVLLASDDGRRWRRLESNDAIATQQVSGDVKRLGLFAVGRKGDAGGGGANPGLIAGAAAGAAVFAGGAAWYVRNRRRAARRAAARKSAARKKRR